MQIVSDRKVLQPAEFDRSLTAGREQKIEHEGKIYVCLFWYDAKGELANVTSQQIA